MDVCVDQTVRDKKPGVPRYASPWIEVGRLTEKERWQAFTVRLMQSAIDSELEDLKRAVAGAFSQRSFVSPSLSFALGRTRSSTRPAALGPSLDLKQQVLAIIDSSKLKILSHIRECLQLFDPTKTSEHDSSTMQQLTEKDEPNTTSSRV